MDASYELFRRFCIDKLAQQSSAHSILGNEMIFVISPDHIMYCFYKKEGRASPIGLHSYLFGQCYEFYSTVIRQYLVKLPQSSVHCHEDYLCLEILLKILCDLLVGSTDFILILIVLKRNGYFSHVTTPFN